MKSMNRSRRSAGLLLAGACWTMLAAPAGAQTADAEARRAADAARAELERARAEVELAREQLEEAAERLARSYAESDEDSPRAFAYRVITDPERAVLGVNVTSQPAEDGVRGGARVVAVTPGSGAEEAGLQSGDVLLSANGVSLRSADGEASPERKLIDVMRDLRPGASVDIEYRRNGEIAQAKVEARPAQGRQLTMGLAPGATLWIDDDINGIVLPRAPLPPTPPVPPVPGAAPLPPRPGLHDLQLARLDDALAPYFDTDRGVLVVHVPADSPLGLVGGDVIQRVDGEAVTTPVEAMERLMVLDPGAELTLDIVRRGEAQTLQATIPQRVSLHSWQDGMRWEMSGGGEP